MARLNNDDLELLSGMLAAEMEAEPFDPGTRGPPKKREPWLPALNEKQKPTFNSLADICGTVGPKYSGKSIGALHRIVRHCYEEWDALYLILGSSAAALAEGVCSDLVRQVLPAWRDGNRAPPYVKNDSGELIENPLAGQLIDNGIGLEYIGWKYDLQTKHPIMKIRNRFGGWSRIRVISIPHADQIDERVRGPAPSGVYVDELTKCSGKQYFLFPFLQLNRRQDIIGPQQFTFSCNPEDPENWVYKWMYEEVVVPANKPGRNWPDDPEKPGIRRDESVELFFVPYEDNMHNVSQKNREAITKALQSDPILTKRLVKGRWIAYPSGEALFKDQFSEGRHVHGNAEKNKGIEPVPGFPIVISFDYGSRSAGYSIGQHIDTPEGTVHLIFDEIAYHKKMIKTNRLAHALLEKLRYWTAWLREKTGDENAAWSVWTIAGDDATTVFRPNSGSVDGRDIQDETRRIIQENPERYRGIEPLHVRGCPRPQGSVKKRVDLTAEALVEDRVLISATCVAHRNMFLYLEHAPDDWAAPKGGNRHIHVFDGFSYAIYYRRYQLPGGFYNFSQNSSLVTVRV